MTHVKEVALELSQQWNDTYVDKPKVTNYQILQILKQIETEWGGEGTNLIKFLVTKEIVV